MRKKNSQARLQSIGEILFSAFKKRGMASRLEESALGKLWPKAVGSQIAAQTQVECLRAGTLFIKTTSSVWVQQLHFMKEDIRTKLNDLAGKAAVKEIHFSVGYRPAPARTGNHAGDSKKMILKERDKKMIADCTAAIADPELATIMKRVMKTEISRRRLWEEKQGR